MANGAVKSSHWRDGYCSLRHVCNGLYLPGCIRGETSFCVSRLVPGLPVMHIVFWCNAYLKIKLFSSSYSFLERFSGVEEDFVLKCIFPAGTQ